MADVCVLQSGFTGARCETRAASLVETASEDNEEEEDEFEEEAEEEDEEEEEDGDA